MPEGSAKWWSASGLGGADMARKRVAARRKLPSSKAIPLTEMMHIVSVAELVAEQTAAGWTAPKSVVCHLGKTRFRWVLTFSRRGDGYRETESHGWTTPPPNWAKAG